MTAEEMLEATLDLTARLNVHHARRHLAIAPILHRAAEAGLVTEAERSALAKLDAEGLDIAQACITWMERA